MDSRGPETNLYSSIVSAPPKKGNEPKYLVSSEPKMTTKAFRFALDQIKENKQDIKDERQIRAALAKKVSQSVQNYQRID